MGSITSKVSLDQNIAEYTVSGRGWMTCYIRETSDKGLCQGKTPQTLRNKWGGGRGGDAILKRFQAISSRFQADFKPMLTHGWGLGVSSFVALDTHI